VRMEYSLILAMTVNASVTHQVLRDFMVLFEKKVSPLSVACDWDNVGVLVEPFRFAPASVKDLKLTLAIDFNKRVLDEAVDRGSNLILSYHPCLFRPIKSLCPAGQSDLLHLLDKNIPLFSCHTSIDKMINKFALFNLFGNLSGYSEIENSNSASMLSSIALNRPLTLSEVVTRVKKFIGMDHIRVAFPEGMSNSNEIAVATLTYGAGSIGSVLNEVPKSTDCLITGELSHHEILSETRKGRAVILCEHTNSERPFLVELKRLLESEVSEIHISTADQDPIVIL
jgi:putative NIF3 family GTP cyclohydrolase 1 type 2